MGRAPRSCFGSTPTGSICGAGLLLVALATAVGCVELQTLPPAPTATSATVLEGLELVEGINRGRLFVRPDHHIGSYDGFVVEPIQLSYKRGQKQLSDDALQGLGNRLKSILSTSISSSGLILGTEPHECLLGLRVEILDLEMLDVDSYAGAATRFIESAGGAILVFEFRDSLSGQSLMRYGQRRRLPGGVVTSAATLSSSGLVKRLGEGLGDMGEAIRLITPTTVAFREGTSCTGKIGQQQGYDASGRPSPNAPPQGQSSAPAP